MVVTPHIRKILGEFHHLVARHNMGRQPRQQADQICQYPQTEEAMKEADLEEIETYISRKYNTVSQYIVTRPFFFWRRRGSQERGW